MYKVFNNGIGLVLVVPAEACQDVLFEAQANKEKAFVIGEIAPRQKGEAPVQIVLGRE